MEILVWSAIVITFATYALFPFSIWLLSKLLHKKIHFDENFKPEITVAISAYNEEDTIAEAIESILNSNYPKEKITILIGSDGSTDNTVQVCENLKIKHPNIKVHDCEHSGKNSTLNKLIPFITTEIIILMDADLRLERDTISNLVRNLADNGIASVQSRIMYVSQASGSNAGSVGENFYHKYENFIRTYESKISSTVNNFGIYAIRRANFMLIPNDKVCDDMYQTFQVIISGKRVIVDENAITYDVRGKNTKDEVNRRVRMVAGGLSTIEASKELMNPMLGTPAMFLWFHKILRWLSPLFLIVFFVALFVLEPNSVLWYILFVSQLILYTFAFMQFISEKLGIEFSIGKIPLFVVMMNWGFLRGIIRYFAGGQNSSWSRTGLQKIK